MSDRTLEIKIDSVNKFIREISNFTLKEEHTRFFRGHKDQAYKLIPSIYRTPEKESDTEYLEYVHKEDKIINTLLASCPTDFKYDNTIFEKLVRLQHYSCPTRLLDLTHNPLVALYFACEKSNTDGEVVILDIPEKDIKNFSSDTVSIISALSLQKTDFSIKTIEESANKLQNRNNIKKLADIIFSNYNSHTKKHKDIKFKELINNINQLKNDNYKRESIEPKYFSQTQDMISLAQTIRTEKPGFLSNIKIEDLEKVICALPKKNNIRVTNQQGAFLLFGIKDTKIEPAEVPEFWISSSKKRFIIDDNKKKDILRELETLGITRQFLFPELEIQASYIKDKYKVEKKKQYQNK